MFRVSTLLAFFALAPGVSAADPATPPAPGFPQSWIGHWAGPAELVTPGRASRRFEMELMVAPTPDPARFSWTIVYAEPGGERQERAYELVVRDAANGLYIIDEKNTITIPATLIDSTLYTSFDVRGVRINTREALEHAGTPEECIRVEMVTASVADAETSGGRDGIPEVRSVVARTLQRVTMKRRPASNPEGGDVP